MGRRKSVSVRRVFFAVGTWRSVVVFMLVMWAGRAVGDNSKFHGTFDMTLSGTEPHPWTEVGTLTIGSEQRRMGEEDYLHLPARGSPATNAWTKEDGAPVSQVLSVLGDTISVDYREDCLDVTGGRFLCHTKEMEFAFSEGYVGAAISGSIWRQDPEEKQGLVTGSLTVVEDKDDDGGGGGGGCFIGAAIARSF